MDALNSWVTKSVDSSFSCILCISWFQLPFPGRSGSGQETRNRDSQGLRNASLRSNCFLLSVAVPRENRHIRAGFYSRWLGAAQVFLTEHIFALSGPDRQSGGLSKTCRQRPAPISTEHG